MMYTSTGGISGKRNKLFAATSNPQPQQPCNTPLIEGCFVESEDVMDKPTCKTCEYYQSSGLCGGIEKQFDAGLFLGVRIVTSATSKACKVHTPKEAK